MEKDLSKLMVLREVPDVKVIIYEQESEKFVIDCFTIRDFSVDTPSLVTFEEACIPKNFFEIMKFILENKYNEDVSYGLEITFMSRDVGTGEDKETSLTLPRFKNCNIEFDLNAKGDSSAYCYTFSNKKLL